MAERGRPRRKPLVDLLPEDEKRIVIWRRESNGALSYKAIAEFLRIEYGVKGLDEEDVRLIARKGGCPSKPHGSSYHGGRMASRA